MKRVYIAHPLRGDVAGNTAKATAICQEYAKQGEVIPFSPLHAFDFMDPTGPQDLVMAYCFALLESCQELWVHGDWRKSEGSKMEIAHAGRMGIPVRYMGGQS